MPESEPERGCSGIIARCCCPDQAPGNSVPRGGSDGRCPEVSRAPRGLRRLRMSSGPTVALPPAAATGDTPRRPPGKGLPPGSLPRRAMPRWRLHLPMRKHRK
uniref:Uncharacterized protein n=1 Tax=Tetraselmis sp. GSL018 TaxID=582737 RepID=A0A061RR85_9CHLO